MSANVPDRRANRRRQRIEASSNTRARDAATAGQGTT